MFVLRIYKSGTTVSRSGSNEASQNKASQQGSREATASSTVAYFRSPSACRLFMTPPA